MSDVRSDVGLFDSSVDGIMWLTTEPEECERRIRNRGRDGEQDISLQYLEQCAIYHRQWLCSDLDFAFRIIDDDKVCASHRVSRGYPSGTCVAWRDHEKRCISWGHMTGPVTFGSTLDLPRHRNLELEIIFFSRDE